MKNEFERMAEILRPEPVPKKYTKIYKKETISKALHVMKCPLCGCVSASATNYKLLPQWCTCDNEECIY